eukprot:3939332-Rhodomonas_salina.1
MSSRSSAHSSMGSVRRPAVISVSSLVLAGIVISLGQQEELQSPASPIRVAVPPSESARSPR